MASNFAELAGFNGLTTGANCVFNSGFTAKSDVYGITLSVSAMPEPQTWALMLAVLLGIGQLSRRRAAAQARSDIDH